MYLTLRYIAGLIMAFSITGSITAFGQVGTVRIGLLIPDSASMEVVHAARLAVLQANERKGADRLPIELVVRSTRGPWGAGSKESVGLVFEDRVGIIVGSLDGRNAHLAEQVAARSHTTYLETRATDPTLTQAFVPWFFRCVPGDDQQSGALVEQMGKNGGGRMAILSAGDYDARLAAGSLTSAFTRTGGRSPEIMLIGSRDTTADAYLDRLAERSIRHLVVTVHSATSLEIIKAFRARFPDGFVYGTLSFTSCIDPDRASWKNYDGMVLVSPDGLVTPRGEAFRAAFKEEYGYAPGIPAYYAFDGINVAMEALRSSGPDQDSVRDSVHRISLRDGVTGSISFDEHGNRIGPPVLLGVRNGKLVLPQPEITAQHGS